MEWTIVENRLWVGRLFGVGLVVVFGVLVHWEDKSARRPSIHAKIANQTARGMPASAPPQYSQRQFANSSIIELKLIAHVHAPYWFHMMMAQVRAQVHYTQQQRGRKLK